MPESGRLRRFDRMQECAGRNAAFPRKRSQLQKKARKAAKKGSDFAKIS
jgi:hypothetical protein